MHSTNYTHTTIFELYTQTERKRNELEEEGKTSLGSVEWGRNIIVFTEICETISHTSLSMF